MVDYKDICQKVCDIAKKAGEVIRLHAGKLEAGEVTVKGKHDLVTVADKESEQLIVSELKKILPDSGFIAEEGTETNRGERYNWIIDPLDGTTNFVHGIAPYAVSIALTEGDKTVIGVVYEVVRDECFYACEGDGAYLNGQRINVSETAKINSCLIATGFPFRNYDRLTPFMDVLKYFILNTRGVRRLGAAAVDLAYIAAGRFDFFFEYDLKPWDVAAGAYIVQRAGGVVCDFGENDNYIFGKEIVASNPFIYNSAIKELKPFGKND